MPFDGAEFGKEMTAIVKQYVSKAVAPLKLQLDNLSEEVKKALETVEALAADQAKHIEADRGSIKNLNDRIEALGEALNALEPAPVLPDIPALVADSVKASMHEATGEVESRLRSTLPSDATVKAMVSEAVNGLANEVGSTARELVAQAVDTIPTEEQVEKFIQTGIEKMSDATMDQVIAKLNSLSLELTDRITMQFAESEKAVDEQATSVEERLKATVDESFARAHEKLVALIGTNSKGISDQLDEFATRVEKFGLDLGVFRDKLEPYPDVKTIETVTKEMVELSVMTYFVENADRFKGETGEPVALDVIENMVKSSLAELNVENLVATTVVKEFETRAAEFKGEPGPMPSQEEVKAALDPVVQEIMAEAIKSLPVPVDGKDGVNLAGALIDRDGELVVTLSNGEAVKLGPVVGKDVDMSSVSELVAKAVNEIPKPKDGRDGVSFEDMDIAFDLEAKELVITAERGENRKVWKFFIPFIVEKGVYKEGTSYLEGDGVTFGGSFWIANKQTDAKPGTNPDWRLSVKKGRDGKDGKNIEPPKPVKLGE